jgi:hypothetical protein
MHEVFLKISECVKTLPLISVTDNKREKINIVREVRKRIINIFNKCLLFYYFLSPQPSAGYGLLVTRGFVITHNDAPQSVGLLWMID